MGADKRWYEEEGQDCGSAVLICHVLGCCLRVTVRSGVVTCIICLPFVCIYLLHLTLYFCMSRQHIPSTQPHHAHAAFLGAVRLYIWATTSLLFFLSQQSTSAEPKTPVNRGDKFPASFGSQGELTRVSLQYKVQTSRLVQPSSRAEPLLFLPFLDLHARSPLQPDGPGFVLAQIREIK